MVLEIREYQLLGIYRISLNPSLGGIWSWRSREIHILYESSVLILLWVEYGLGAAGESLTAGTYVPS